MDPDATLARIRKAQGEIAETGSHEAVMEFVDATIDLLDWLARGGFPPDWKKV